MKRGFLAACLIVLFFPASGYAASPSFEQALNSVLIQGKPSRFNGTVHVERADSDVLVKVRGAGEKGKIAKTWIALDITGTIEGQNIDLSIELRFKNGKTYIRVDEAHPDVFFSHWKGAKGAWYVLPVSLTMGDLERMLPMDGNAADLASVLKVVTTRFQAGNSFAFWMPSLSGKIDANADNEFRFLSGTYWSADTDKTVTANFKMERQFVSVYVETPKGNIKPFPVGTLEQNTLLRSVGADALADKLQAVVVEEPEPVAALEPASVVEMPVWEEPIMEEEQPEMTVLTTPEATVTVRSRTVRRNGRELLSLVGQNGQNVKVQARVVKNPDDWASVVDMSSDYGAGRGVLYLYSTPSYAEYSAEFAGRSLDVIFFDAYGSYISSATMPRCTANECPVFLPSSPASYVLEAQEGFIRQNKIGALTRMSLDRAALSPVIDTTERSVSDREARRRRDNLNVAPALRRANALSSNGGEQLVTLAATLAGKLRGADVSAVMASGTAATLPMERLYALLKDAELSNPGVTYVYLVSPAKGANTFKLLVDNYTLLSSDLLDLDRSGTVDADEMPAVPGTVYQNALFTQALKSPVTERSGGEMIAYVPVKDGAGNVLAVLAVSKTAR